MTIKTVSFIFSPVHRNHSMPITGDSISVSLKGLNFSTKENLYPLIMYASVKEPMNVPKYFENHMV